MTNETIWNAGSLGKKRVPKAIVPLTFLGLLVLQGCGGSSTSDDEPGADTASFVDCVDANADFVETNLAAADTANGGLLYDKWYESRRPTPVGEPTLDQALWEDRATDPATGEFINNRGPKDNWRCKECHGWDYQGANGAYGPSNSHYTGFIGIYEAAIDATKPPVEIFCSLKAGTEAVGVRHSFIESDVLPEDRDLLDLTKFIKDSVSGVAAYAISEIVDADGGVIVAGADAGDGEPVFTQRCSACHLADGSANAGDEGLGAIASGNPWEFIHKVRFGDISSANATMPAWLDVTQQQLGSLILYARASLKGGVPTGGGGSDIVQGGLLYDKWWDALDKAPPTTLNPVYRDLRISTPANDEIAATKPADTWRCKECHGWDYKGVEGQYGNPDNKHYTGFISLKARLDAGTLNEEGVFSYLKFGIRNSNNSAEWYHRFGEVEGSVAQLSDAQISSLVEFIFRGIIETGDYIVEDPAQPILFKAAVGGDPARGNALYFGGATPDVSCGNAACHNVNGDGIDFGGGEFLGALSRDNPWEVLHKARFGQPGVVGMIPTLRWITDDQTQAAVDVLRYAQDSLN